LLRSSFASVSQEIGLSEIDKHQDVLRDGKFPVLRGHYLDVLGRKDDVLRVRIKQVFVGSCEAGKPVDNDVASMFFATYTDPASGEELCSFKRNADACFSRVINVGCDPKTSLAQVNLYARSKSFGRYEELENPKVGRRCFPSDQTDIKRVRIQPETLPCDDDYATQFEPGEACVSVEPDLILYPFIQSRFILDRCNSGSYCRIDSSKCKDPNRNPLAPPATCVALGKQCSSDSECKTPTEYCLFGRCTPYSKDGECCAGDQLYEVARGFRQVKCHGNSKCTFLYSAEDLNKEDYLPRPPRVCRPPCTSDADCVSGVEVCGPPDSTNRLQYCECNTDVCKKDKLAWMKFREKYLTGD